MRLLSAILRTVAQIILEYRCHLKEVLERMMRDPKLSAMTKQRVTGEDNIGHLHRTHVGIAIAYVNDRVILCTMIEQMRALATAAMTAGLAAILEVNGERPVLLDLYVVRVIRDREAVVLQDRANISIESIANDPQLQ